MPYTIVLEPLGREFPAGGAASVLDAALAAGINLPHSCKSGHCGSCRARIVRGRVGYPRTRPPGLTAQEAEAGMALLCQARAESDLRIEARQIETMSEVEIKSLPCRIESLRPLARDVMQLWLRLPAVEPLHFRAGQYLDIILDDGRRRSFSIASPPHDSRLLELHVRRAAGGRFSPQLFGELRAGALLRIEAPLGQFYYRDATAPLLLIAGGTGFAPLKSILRHVSETGIERDVLLYWGVQRPEDLYDGEFIAAQLSRGSCFRFQPVFSAAAADGTDLRRGFVHDAVLEDLPSLEEYDCYAAGPPALIEALRREFPARGLSPSRLYFDSFDYAPDAARS
ncbi:MAG: 2Fe-2S iron-sulfur cluster-binding protein [Steroidobacteraceae bacterium]